MNLLLHPLFADHMVLQRGTKVPVWGDAKPNQHVSARVGEFTKTTISDANGSWIVWFDNLPPGGPFELLVASDNGQEVRLRDVYVGEVWLCSGQSNMDQRVATGSLPWCGVENEIEEIIAANYPLIRLYSVRLQMADEPCARPASHEDQHVDLKAPPYSGKWQVCSPETAGEFSATAYFFARELQKAIRVPIGLITSCYGASTIQSWIGRDQLNCHPELRHLHTDYELCLQEYANGRALAKYRQALTKWRQAQEGYRLKGDLPPPHKNKKPRIPKNPRKDQHSPSVMYNGMIAPLIPYAVQGVIWHHGESAQRNKNEYALLLKTLIRAWRRAWRIDFTFLIVQFPNVNKANNAPIEYENIPLIRAAQAQALTIENTALVVNMTLGNCDFHSRDKQQLGANLALAARGLAYGEAVRYMGPLVQEITQEDRSLRIHFKDADGLWFKGDLQHTFVISGEDGVFYWAEARIEGVTVVVSNPEVMKPLKARYAWAENPRGILYNQWGLAAAPFRWEASSDLAGG